MRHEKVTAHDLNKSMHVKNLVSTSPKCWNRLCLKVFLQTMFIPVDHEIFLTTLFFFHLTFPYLAWTKQSVGNQLLWQ